MLDNIQGLSAIFGISTNRYPATVIATSPEEYSSKIFYLDRVLSGSSHSQQFNIFYQVHISAEPIFLSCV